MEINTDDYYVYYATDEYSKDVKNIADLLDELIRSSEGKQGLIIEYQHLEVLANIRDVLITFKTLMSFLRGSK